MASQSMTGFGKGEATNDVYTLSVEIKSVNNRFKDIRFKMGSVFNAKEMELRKKVEAAFSRGSFDIFVNYKKNPTLQSSIDLDFEKINAFVTNLKNQINHDGLHIQISPTDFIRSDFYVEDEAKEDLLTELLEVAFVDAIKSLTLSREEEGQKLVDKLIEHRSEYKKSYLAIPPLKNNYQEKVKEKLTKRFESDANELKVEESRFLQEVIYYLEKLDIEEEISRIQIHLEKLDGILESKSEEVGRQIDFLIQELNRETNTIGSKSGASEISELVVQMKVQLEKIREQALNLQ